jgi:hypothetical protein
MAAAFPDVQLPSLADDTHIVGAPARAIAAFEHLQGGLSTLSLRVKLEKCAAYSSAVLSPGLSIPPDFPLPSHGIIALGAPIGSAAHIHEVVGAKLLFSSEQLTTLSMLRDLQVASTLHTRVFVQRPSYLMRTVTPFPEFLEQLRGFDGLVLRCLESLLGPDAFAGEAGELTRRRVTLPTPLGGLKVRSSAAIALAAFLGGWALIGSLVAQRFIRSGEPFLRRRYRMGLSLGVCHFRWLCVQLGIVFRVRLRATRLARLPSLDERQREACKRG